MFKLRFAISFFVIMWCNNYSIRYQSYKKKSFIKLVQDCIFFNSFDFS